MLFHVFVVLKQNELMCKIKKAKCKVLTSKPFHHLRPASNVSS